MHRLLDKNLDDRTGTCAICGPVKIVKINQGGTCAVGHQETNVRKYPKGDGDFTRLSGRDRLALLKEFGNECMICFVDVSHNPQLDHCHDTGEWRGVLCRDCNIGLGMFKDHTPRLINAILYLSQSSVATNIESKVK